MLGVNRYNLRMLGTRYHLWVGTNLSTSEQKLLNFDISCSDPLPEGLSVYVQLSWTYKNNVFKL